MFKYIFAISLLYAMFFLGCTNEKKQIKKVSQNLEQFVDSNTGYAWIDDNQTKRLKKDWLDAKSYCEGLYANGYDDWNLPSKKQLISIVDKSNNPSIKTDFKNVAAKGYWTNDEIDIKDGYVWAIYFNHGGEVWELKTDTNYVRCVRSDHD